MTHASLFTGIGGFDLAAQWMGWENIFQIEKDKYCNKVLEKNFPKVKRYGDIKEFNGTEYRGTIDVFSGKISVTKSKRMVFRLRVSRPGMNGTGYGLLLKTLTAFDATVASGKKNPKFGDSGSLAQEIMSGFIVNRMLPTLTHRDYRGQHAENSEAFLKRLDHPRGVNLVEFMQRTGNIGKLNPEWCEWFMGYPIGWTELKDSEIPSIHGSPSKCEHADKNQKALKLLRLSLDSNLHPQGMTIEWKYPKTKKP